MWADNRYTIHPPKAPAQRGGLARAPGGVGRVGLGALAKSGELCTEVCDSPDRYLQGKREVWEPRACQKGFRQSSPGFLQLVVPW